MLNVTTKDFLSLLLSIRYSYSQNESFNYSNEPRPCHNVAFMLEGEGVIETKETTLTIKAGDLLFIPKDTTYVAHWIACPKVSFHSLHFLFSQKNDPLFHKNIPVQILPNEHFGELYTLLTKIQQYQFSNTTDAFIALSAFFDICGKLFPSIRVLPSNPPHKAILPALQFIEKNYATPMTVNELATLCFLSPSRFHYLFKQQTGVSPIVYKNQVAISHATKDLICDLDESVGNIAKANGFSNLIYFERLFKKLTGKTPSEYRKQPL